MSDWTSGSRTASRYAVADGNGNIVALVDADSAAGAIETVDYDPFGNVLARRQTAAGVSGPSLCPFGFSSKYLDADTGLLYFGYRYYSPDLGRWLARDPLQEQGGDNLYAYCQNDPVNAIDPLGLTDKKELEELRSSIINSASTTAEKYPVTAALLRHYAMGNTDPYCLDPEWMMKLSSAMTAINTNNQQIAEVTLPRIAEEGMPSAGEVTIRGDYWPTVVNSWKADGAKAEDVDAMFSLGGFCVSSYVLLKLEKNGSRVTMQGRIQHAG